TRFAAVIAPAGARVGSPREWASPPAPQLDGCHVLVGATDGDKWISRADLDATVAWFAQAGAVVDDVSGPGTEHEVTLRQRIRAREIVLGRAEPAATGFGNTLTSEARPDTVPALQNTPRVAPHGLYP